MVSDPVGDLIMRLNNAQQAGLLVTTIPYSNHKWEIAEALKKAGWLKNISKKGKKLKKFIEAELLYADGQPKIQAVKRVSKPSRRVYQGAKEIKSVRQGYGIAVYSTPAGIMLDRAAREAKVGGELLFTLY